MRLERARDAGDWWNVDDLKLTIRDTGETITVKRHFEASDRYAVEEIVFADGTVWDAEAIKSRVLLGEEENEVLRGFSDRADVIEGGAGNDTLSGLSGNDTLSGGAGDDVLEGGAGSDTYRFGMGGGRDVVVEGYDATAQDVAELAPGILPSDVTVRWTLQGDMAVLLADGSRLSVRNQANPWSASDGVGIEQVRFADGTVWDRAELATRALAATDGNDAIVGGYEADTLEGGAGDDRFQDLGGYDTYHFGVGDGHDVAEDSAGRLLFKPGIDQNDIAFSRDGSDLVATVSTSGDSVRIKGWLDSGSIDRFEFANGARLGVGDVLEKLNVSEGGEVLYGSPGDDALAGTGKDSTLYGREGNDTLTGGAGQDALHGEDGDDTLDGGAGRDWLYGGAGQNTYIVAPGTGLDNALLFSASVADDTVLFAPGIRPEDVSVQLGERSWDSDPGNVGYARMVVGIGGDDALVLQNQDGNDLGRGAIRRFRFADGTELTLADMIARADGGVLGWRQRYDGDSSILLGSQGDDWIEDYTGESVTVKARGNDDDIYLMTGNDIVSAGSGNDNVSAGAGNDLIAGEIGDDRLDGGDGEDVFVFNHGDGRDVVMAREGLDTLSFGAGVTPGQLSVAFDRDGRVVLLVDGGAGGAITLGETRADNLPGDLERLQFIDAEGRTRIFDFAGWLRSNAAALPGATLEAPLAFDGAGFELTGTVAPAGGLEAVAHAQTGDLFATASLTANTPTDGDDVLYGTPDGDTLDAGSGNDIVLGLAGNDTGVGGEGNDLIHGGDGDDVLEGGAGGDLYVIETSGGTDTILDSEGAGEPNVLVLPEGTTANDVRLSFDTEDFLILDLDNTGNRIRLSGFDPMNPAVERFRFGPSGDEIGYEELLARGFNIVGIDAGDALGGTILADRISGGAGNDLIDATPGGDALSGGAGNDVFAVNLGDGEVTIDDIATQEAGNVLRFDPGIEADRLRNNLRFAMDGNGGHILLIPYGESGDVVRLTGFNPEDVLGGGHAVDRFEFADGTVVDYATLVSWTVVIEGDSADNALDGTTVGDRLYGYAGDDVLDAGGGGDVLTGGAGNDALRGGSGRDAYVVNPGDGEDVIVDGVEAGLGNVLTFGAGIAREDVRVEVDGNDLLIHYGDGGDRLRVNDYAPADAAGATVIDTFEFADGGTVSLREFMNRAPELANPIGDRIALEDAAFRLTLPDDLFSDAEGDAVLSRVVISTDTPLPEWLQYDAETRTLHGTPRNDDVGEFDVIVQGFDMLGASAFHGFRVTVRNTNDAPEVATLITNQQAAEDAPFSFTVPEGTFRDVDTGDALTFSATQADGAALPAWLNFDAATRTFSGLPGNSDVGNVSLRVWAADLAGAQASQAFNVAVANVNDTPQAGIALTDQAARMGNPFVWRLPQGAFVDIDAGDTLTYSARLADGSALPEWLSFDAATGSFSDTPATTGRYDIQVTASDLAGTQVSQSFALDVAGGNLPPVTTQDTASVIEDRKLLVWGNVLANDADPEGGRLSVSTPGIWRGEYGVLTLLSGGGYAYGLDDLSSRVQALGAGESVVDRFTYLASDGQSSATGELAVTVQGTNDAPQLSRALADVQLAKGRGFSWQVPAGSFTDRDRSDTLSYTATLSDGKPLPAWLKFDASRRTFSGTAPTNGKGNLDIRVVASDSRGEDSTASDIFRISFGNTTIVPTSAEGLSNDVNTLSLGSPAGVNDAPGAAASGQPRRRTEPARDDDPLARFLEGFKADAKPAHPALPVLDRDWFAQWDDRQRTTPEAGQAREENDFRRHWSELAHALNRLDAERQGLPAWNNPSQGADLSGMAGLMRSDANSTRGGVDAVSLTCSSGTRLIGFAGLHEGIGKLSC